MLMVEEGQPDFIEQALATILRQADIQTAHRRQGPAADGRRIHRRRRARRRRRVHRDATRPDAAAERAAVRRTRRASAADEGCRALADARAAAPAGVLHRLPGAADLRGDEAGRARARAAPRQLPTSAATCSRSCRRSTSAPPRWATGSAAPAPRRFNAKADKRAIAVMGDGGFWHNGLTCGVGNAVFNKHDDVIIIVDNGYSAATGGQDILSSRADNAIRIDAATRSRRRCAASASNWVRTIDRTYDVAEMRDTLQRGADHARRRARRSSSPQSECMLNRQRREQPLVAQGGRSAASAWCASASASMTTPAPATTPASACRAARR